MGRRSVYDIEVEGVHHYILSNGLLSHNSGAIYAANTIFIVTKAQEKNSDQTQLLGYKFTLNIEKSRYVREKSKIPLKVLFNGGIYKWSGLPDLAIEAGFITKINTQFYQLTDPETGEVLEKRYRMRDIEANDEFFEKLIKQNSFKQFVNAKYALAAMDQVNTIEPSEEEDEVLE